MIKAMGWMTITLSVMGFSTNAFAKRYINAKNSEVNLRIGDYKQDALKTDLKVFVWNMYKGDKPDWKKEYKRLTKGMDILVLQELYIDQKMSEVFQEDENFAYDMATSFFDSKKGWIPSGVAIASDVQPLRSFWQRSHYREPFIRTPKMVLFNEFAVEGSDQNLLVVTIHAINFVSSRKLRHQLRQVGNVVREHRGPVLFGGDFNTWSKKKERYMRKEMARAGLSEVALPGGRMRTFRHYLDYVFVKGLNVNYTKVHGGSDGSDHKAIELGVSVK
ncbi:MAG: endonuclease/exonuclease/phosphatase family protein [Halobacteriovoraceae bacterium]|nr:endonuclease/exonuclease/phosphatase family protein [Halobacteriovoraceae bacterium]MBT5095630.1 endonuclease/exonuclease/phosphatase family protein [Halobacteriovoraceae bacterium]